jgi:hypothetical protein
MQARLPAVIGHRVFGNLFVGPDCFSVERIKLNKSALESQYRNHSLGGGFTATMSQLQAAPSLLRRLFPGVSHGSLDRFR